ncbi:M14 family metallopeptidase [Aestuariibaculum suncheonense]|uniref:Uncharacterized protein n=1 Tax=Aestuariibaculum suncheonense TaxID=1028745 RepID=A0A8J6UBJ0_9FLAO|nr:hypothetical protein [Aestuariibaculum suncheonense]MBD0836338.1 hypothetical protein [Aestuariibaculum suncheonense]
MISLMVDFIKVSVDKSFEKRLLENQKLEFNCKICYSTGVVDSNFLYAEYKGLRFNIINSENDCKQTVITLEGSLHKFWNDGKHNHNDFTNTNLDEVLNELVHQFGLWPSDMRLRQIEFGVNIRYPECVDEIMNGCLEHKAKPFKYTFVRDEGKYIQAKHENYIVKLYDKQLQNCKRYPDLEPIMRFEVGYKRMYSLNKKGIYTLQDLVNYGLEEFGEELVCYWEAILFYDAKVFDGSDKQYIYSNPKYWRELSSTNFNYHRGQMRKALSKSSKSIKRTIRALIKEKSEQLVSHTV